MYIYRKNILMYFASSNFVFSLTVLIGLFSGSILKSCGFLVNKEGIQYYAQVHQSEYNAVIHTIFMPLTVYSISCWIPALFGLILGKWFNIYHKVRLQRVVWLWYIVHYTSINPLVAYATTAWYTIACGSAYEKIVNGYSSIGEYITSLFCKNTKINKIHNWQLFIHGLIWMVISLTIQEVLGHWYGGDDPSRFEGIPNAILYAGIYPMWHTFKGMKPL